MISVSEVDAMPSLGQLLPDIRLGSPLSQMPVAGLTIDSREVQPGYVFVAMQGLQLHGKRFAEMAIANGAAAILLDADDSLEATVPVIKVPDLSTQLSAIAGRFYGQPSHMVPVLAVTGTNGKTTCTQLLAQAFAHLDIPCGVMGTLGYGLLKANKSTDAIEFSLTETGMTTTDAISTQAICADLHEQGASLIAMEASSHGLAQHRLADIFIRTAVFTNLTHDHLDYHGSMAAYAEAKASLFTMASVSAAVINLDDDFSAQLIQRLRPDVELVSYSLDAEKADNVPSSAHFSLADMTISDGLLALTVSTPEGEFVVTTQLLGQFNVSNLLALIATLYVNRYRMSDIVDCIPKLKPVPGRMEVIGNQAGLQVVIDYAHTPDALKQALQALRVHAQGELWCVFGCGGDRDREKRPKMAAIAEQLADKVVLTSDNPRTEPSEQIFADIEAGFSRSHDVIPDRAKAIEFAIANAKAGALILIAGKGHENYQLIGDQRLTFSDHAEARLALRQREQLGQSNNNHGGRDNA